MATDFDQKRDQAIYSYLFYCFALVLRDATDPDNLDENINFNKTGKRFDKNADFAQRIYRTIHNKVDSGKPGAPNITIGRLVELLKNLRQNLKEEELNKTDTVAVRLLKTEDILRAFQTLTQLSPKEKEDLGLTNLAEEILLQQILLNIGLYPKNKLSQESILNLYKSSLGLGDNSLVISDNTLKTEKEINDLIENTVRDSIADYPEHLKTPKQVEKLINQVKRNFNRIKSLSGNRETEDFNSLSFNNLSQRYLSNYFVTVLTRTVIKNDFINEKFPIYIKSLEIKNLPPLPLFYHENDNDNQGLLNKKIINHNNQDNTGVESQYAYEVIINFYVKIPENYTPQFPKNYNQLIHQGEKRLNFSVSSSGVGGKFSQIIQIINRTLLWDIQGLREKYFPIAHDLMINLELIKNDIASPVWSHSLVRLCKLETIKQALIEKSSYNDLLFLEEVGRGDYCGFDLIETGAKSALQARLDAIQNTGIISHRYMKDLCIRVERVEQLKIAESYLKFYPFSLSAMDSHLHNGLLKDLRENPHSLPSFTHYQAGLTLIEGYLTEGLHRKAYKLLTRQAFEELKNYSRQAKNLNQENDCNDFEIFSGSILVYFELCWANYYYLSDQEDYGSAYQPRLPNNERTTYINACWKALKNAETHLKIRLIKYKIIDEISQGIFNPYFLLKAKIDFLKAKLCLFFPCQVENLLKQDEFLRNYHYGRLYYLEQARLNAARNGDTELYTCYSAYQSFAYMMTAYLNSDENTLDLSRETCLNWAKKLRDNALICYSEIGCKCYYQIKEKSGIGGEFKQYGNCKIDNIPTIKEEQSRRDPNSPIGFYPEDNLLHLDMSLLWIKEFDEELNNAENIYLFGTNAAILNFSRGMYELCGDENTESLEKWKEKILSAYRLNTYAWAMATDGCQTQQQDDGSYRIIRNFDPKQITQDYHSPEVISVRDLYPHRITEIADLGKVFAAACRLILMYLEPENQNRHNQDILDLVSHFYDPTHYEEITEINEEQKRYNGHLETYLKRVEKILISECNEFSRQLVERNINSQFIKTIRTKILYNLFDSFYREPK